jgi:hypothetical protein
MNHAAEEKLARERDNLISERYAWMGGKDFDAIIEI